MTPCHLVAFIPLENQILSFFFSPFIDFISVLFGCLSCCLFLYVLIASLSLSPRGDRLHEMVRFIRLVHSALNNDENVAGAQ